MTSRTAYDGTGVLLRLALRRDRVRISVAAVVIGAVMGGSARSVTALYPTHAQLGTAAEGIAATPAGLAVYGPAADLDTVGGLTLWKPGGLVLVITALLCAMAVVRHTRADEEEGRAELAGSGAVGRSAPLTAGLIVAAVEALAISVVVAGALAVVAHPVSGAVGAGLSILVVGLAFAGLAAVTAQLAQTSRVANGLALGGLGAAYALRAAGDAARASGTGGGWLADVSPIGWAQALRPYGAAPRWWVLLLPVVLGAGLVVVAAALRERRDLGAGLVGARPGPARAPASLAGAYGLAWRLQRGVLLAWTIALALVGLLVGAIASSVSDLIGDSASVHRLLAQLGGQQALSDAYLAATVNLLGLALAACAVQSVLRLHGEESAGRVEPLLGLSLGRIRLALSHWVLAAGAVVVLALVLGLSAGLADGLHSGERPERIGALVAAALAQVPAAWVLAGIAALLVAVVPARSALAWAVLGLAAVLGQFGEVLGLPSAVRDLSPYAHVPHLPAAGLTVAGVADPLVVLTLVAAGLGGLALAGLRRRDLPT
jgi:ABC-2 type transport system permease protein